MWGGVGGGREKSPSIFLFPQFSVGEKRKRKEGKGGKERRIDRSIDDEKYYLVNFRSGRSSKHHSSLSPYNTSSCRILMDKDARDREGHRKRGGVDSFLFLFFLFTLHAVITIIRDSAIRS